MDDNPREMGRQTIWICRSRWCRMWTAVCVMHQQFTSLSLFHCLCQGNPGIPRLRGPFLLQRMLRHSSHSGNTFLPFCTWTIGFSLFVSVPFIISSAVPLVLSPSVFCSPSVTRRSNTRKTIKIYAESTSVVDTCFVFGIWRRILRCIIMIFLQWLLHVFLFF